MDKEKDEGLVIDGGYDSTWRLVGRSVEYPGLAVVRFVT